MRMFSNHFKYIFRKTILTLMQTKNNFKILQKFPFILFYQCKGYQVKSAIHPCSNKCSQLFSDILFYTAFHSRTFLVKKTTFRLSFVNLFSLFCQFMDLIHMSNSLKKLLQQNRRRRKTSKILTLKKFQQRPYQKCREN